LDSFKDDKTIFFAGRIVREKGLTELLSALALVNCAWKLVVAGDGPDLPRVKETAKSIGA
jgi:glycosyltransferase involved in cell wall biosynthesis